MCVYVLLQGQARRIKKENPFYRLKCKGCQREFLSSRQKDYCFDCEEKRR